MIKISSTKSPNKKERGIIPCPFKLLKKFSKARGPYQTDNEPFFTYSDHSPVTARQLHAYFKTIVKEAGFNERYYGTHSLRSGRTVDLYKLGLSVETIKKLGR